MSSFAGWLNKPFKLGRALSEKEARANLRSPEMPRLNPLNKGAIHLDSTCLEYLDRYFLVRGWGVLGGGLFVSFCLAGGGLMIYGLLQSSQGEIAPVFWSLVIFGVMFGIPPLVAMKLVVLKDAFRYTHYPVRFNRVNRKVYVFTGGARKYLEVPFDEAYFIIGEEGGAGGNNLRIYDLRMHVIEAGQIVHTVSIGSDGGSSPGVVLAHWEMIRRFMDEGMEALPFPPLGIFASSRVSVKNAFIIPFAVISGPLTWVFAPFLLPVAVARYIALATSKRPVWPRSVDGECAPPSGGPVLREPLMYGDLPGGDSEEVAFTQYWNEAEEQARAQDANLVAILNGEVR